jgi:hypothetical protein
VAIVGQNNDLNAEFSSLRLFEIPLYSEMGFLNVYEFPSQIYLSERSFDTSERVVNGYATDV